MNLLSIDRLPENLRHAIALRELAPEQILFRQGDSASAFFIVEAGRFRIARYVPEGRSLTLQIAKAGDSFAEITLFSDVYAYTATAEIASRIIIYPKRELLAALHQHSDLLEDFMTRLIRKNLSLITQLQLKNIRAAHRRVLQYLYFLADAENVDAVSFDRPLNQIAIDLGLSPATFSRALTRLEQEGRIVREQNLIRLQNSSIA
ncbi:MAG: Crp/Fnr family transcriptional regulator [Leptolyngbyaceae cyanobacterium SM1_3_5]|nr:Crp/Fnr family transcriptional regulator [Leptolyngbyaceae cyanobacterium SM1_3_5]